MEKLIPSLIGTALFVAFVAGLAESIGAVPFIIIVAIVIAMLLVDVYESNRGVFSGNGRRSSGQQSPE